MNDNIGPEGLCPTLLVFGTLQRPARNAPSDTQIMRTNAIEKGMKEVRTIQAKRCVSFRLRSAVIPVAKESSRICRIYQLELK